MRKQEAEELLHRHPLSEILDTVITHFGTDDRSWAGLHLLPTNSFHEILTVLLSRKLSKNRTKSPQFESPMLLIIISQIS